MSFGDDDYDLDCRILREAEQLGNLARSSLDLTNPYTAAYYMPGKPPKPKRGPRPLGVSQIPAWKLRRAEYLRAKGAPPEK